LHNWAVVPDPTPLRTKRRFSSLQALEVDFPIGRTLIEELRIRGLQCGCGDAVRRRWLNSDFRALVDEGGSETRDGQLFRVDEDRFYLQHDALERFPLEDEVVDLCFSEHFIEHLGPAKGIAWLAEMRRVLRPGGVLRLVTPDLRKYVEGYLDPQSEFFSEHGSALANLPRFKDQDSAPFERRAFMVNQIFMMWEHRWIYDLDEIRHAAVQAGFDGGAIEEVAFREGTVPNLRTLDIPWREDESIYVEIRKT
jgi:predicted SAM-dependent methyltransferase